MNLTTKVSPEGRTPLRDIRGGEEQKNVSYLAQVGAHLYFIISGLWLTVRWFFKQAVGMKPCDVMTERARLQQRFVRYLELLHRWDMVEIEFSGFEDCEHWERSVIAPNHPSLFDAVILVAHIKGLDCVMNAKLLQDPVMCGAARLCGYICNNAPIQMIKTCEERLSGGANILIFPEGTRTKAPPLGEFHHGYAYAAIRAGATIRTVFIECDSLYFGSGFLFFRPAKCPLRYRITAGKVFHPAKGDDPRDVSHKIEAYYREALEAHEEGVRRK